MSFITDWQCEKYELPTSFLRNYKKPPVAINEVHEVNIKLKQTFMVQR
jgi:hypothetical protein